MVGSAGGFSMKIDGQITFAKVNQDDGSSPPSELRTSSRATVSTSADSDVSAWSDRDDDIDNFASEQTFDVSKFHSFDMQVSPAESNLSMMTTSRARSDFLYPEPSQTMVILDWDDTLFPTTEFFDRWGLDHSKPLCLEDLDKERQMFVQEWRQSLKEYMQRACALSDSVVIVTNSRRPWVSDCIDRFVPELAELFNNPERAPRVVYARECVKPSRREQAAQMTPIRSRLNVAQSPPSDEELTEEMTKAKYAAMKQEAKRFYSQYPGQSWKNILSCGDMKYEHFAVQELSFKRVPIGKERLRTKSQLVPVEPTVSELALRLRFCKLMLPAYIFYDGDFEMDLQSARDPLETIADALRMPELASVSFSRHAWGCSPRPQTTEEVNESLAHLAVTVHESLFD